MKANKHSLEKRIDGKRHDSIEEDLNLRLRQQEAIASIGEFAIRCQNLDDLFQETARLVVQVLDMEFCKVLELLPDGQHLFLRAGVGWKNGLVGQALIGTGDLSQAGYTLLSAEPVIVSDLRAETRFQAERLLLDHHVISGMSVAIPGKLQPFGVLSVNTVRPRSFISQDTRFIKGVATILASAVERFRVEEELRRSRDELAIILNGVSEGITVQEGSGNVVYANQAAAEFLGYESVEALNSIPSEQVVKNFELFDQAGNALPIEQLPGRLVLKGIPKASARIHYQVIKTGEDRWSITDAKPVYDADGRVIKAVNIFRDITDVVRTEQHQQLLLDAGTLLASSLDYETTLANVTELIVRNLADWCSVHLLTEDEKVYRVSVAHRDPSKLAMALEFEKRYPANENADSSLNRVLKTGKPEFFPTITDEMLQATAQDAEHLQMIRSLQFRSVMVVPLTARNRTLGAITLVWADSGRRYTQAEVYLVQELANRAAIAIDNARLFQEAQVTNTRLEERVASRTRQLSISNEHLLKEIEERRKAENALIKSETLLSSLFESAPDALILVDKDGKIVRANQQAETLFNYHREELIGLPVETLLPDRFRSQHTNDRRESFSMSAVRPMGAGMQLAAMRKDGTEFPVDIMLSPVQTDEGEQIISAVRDITEQKRLQTELEETHRRLFESVEAERLLLAQELHDGPIQELYGMTLRLEAFRESLSSAEQADELASVGESVQAIIQTLRGVCGELRPPVLTQFGLEKAIRSHLLKVQDAHPDLQVTADLMRDGQVLSERNRLALFRIYQSAINNVIRHAQAQNINVEFRMGEKMIVLKIQDDGRGFNLPGKWVEFARSGHFGLVGIAERAEVIGGRLKVESAPGRGTTIRVEVPRE